ncbi:MAG: LrgB family protein [Alphaproteobacteria bacterium]
MTEDGASPFSLWVYLSSEPLGALTVTVLAYLAGDWVYRRANLNPLLNPVLTAVLLLAGLLAVSGVDYAQYFEGAQFVHFLLGPATVALAVPLYKNMRRVKESFGAMLAVLVTGSGFAAASAVAIAMGLGGERQVLASLAPKSVTSPIAMGVAEKIGGIPALTAVLVILTGVIGAVFGTWVMNACRVTDWRARGLAMGIAAHGIGTARAFTVNETAGAFASLGMGLNGLVTAILLPLLMSLL